METWWGVREHPWWCQRGGPNSLIISPQLDPLASPPWASTKHVCIYVSVCVFLFAFTLLSSSYRQVRSVSTENLSHWSLRHNWTGHLSLFFLPLCVCVCVCVCVLSLNSDMQLFKGFVWQIHRGQSSGCIGQWCPLYQLDLKGNSSYNFGLIFAVLATISYLIISLHSVS